MPNKKPSSRTKLIWAGAVFTLAYAWLGAPGEFHPAWGHEAWTRLAMEACYGLTLLVCACGLFLLMASRGAACLVLVIVAMTCHAVDLGYELASGSLFDSSELVVASNELRLFPNVIGAYGGYIATALAAYLLAIALLVLVRRRLDSYLLPKVRNALVVYLAGLLMVLWGISWNPSMRSAYASAYRIPALLVYAGISPEVLGLRLPYAPRRAEEPGIGPAGPARPEFRNIIVIVDESVNGAFLSVNGYDRDTTPFLRTHPELFVNLGIASSCGNCSASSNYILRNGLLPGQLPDSGHRTFGQPSLFSFARRAGYATHMFECQAQGGVLDDYMSDFDLRDIDDYRQVRDPSSPYLNDFAALEQAKALLAGEGRHFLYWVKMGAHFPYHWRYPDDERIFVPDLSRDSGVVIAPTRENGREFLNSYLNALHWNVDHFLEHLLQSVDPRETAVIYTSDHGQSLGGNDFERTHCSTENPPASQAEVPLLLFGEGLARLAGRAAPGGYSHFRIFPTVLALLGYDEAAVAARYGRPLWDGPEQGRVFFSGPLFSGEGRLNPFPDSGE